MERDKLSCNNTHQIANTQTRNYRTYMFFYKMYSFFFEQRITLSKTYRTNSYKLVSIQSQRYITYMLHTIKYSNN
jgi:hypothetical protein